MNSLFAQKKQHLLSLGLLLLLLGFTVYMLLRNQELPQLFALLGGADKRFLGVALATLAAFYACEALCLKMLGRGLGYPKPFRRNYGYSLMGFYFSAITPGAGAGQPA